LFLGFCFAIGMALLRLSNNLFLNFFAKTYIF
jgi:ABC-type arginine/histidine transport system permease subunit